MKIQTGGKPQEAEATSYETAEEPWSVRRLDDGTIQEIKRLLVERFKEVPQVKSICAKFGPEEVAVWTLIDDYNREARERVYEKELKICRELAMYDFDFRVTSSEIVSSEELVRAGSREIYRRP